MPAKPVYAKIAGTGSYLPKRIMRNAEWEKWVDTSDEWIVSRTGIHARHIADPEESASSMGIMAAQQALAMADLAPHAIDLILVTSSTHELVWPACACVIQVGLGITNLCPAFDVGSAACSGFIYALSIADAFIRSGQYHKILIVSTEIMSRMIDWKDRNTCVLFGDGAGAIILESSQNPGILRTKIYAQGQLGDILRLENKSEAYISMDGPAVYKQAVQRLGELITDFQNDPEYGEYPIDWLVPHQANSRIIHATAKKLNLSMDKVICTVDQHSNTSSASIPLALDRAVRDGRIQRGHHLFLEAFGSGLTWGSCFVKF